jgi:hypothetical protein
MDMAAVTTNASIVHAQAAGTQSLPAPVPPKPGGRKARTGELNRLVHAAIDRHDIDLVDVIAEEVAEDHPHILFSNALGKAVRSAISVRRGQLDREIERWL